MSPSSARANSTKADDTLLGVLPAWRTAKKLRSRPGPSRVSATKLPSATSRSTASREMTVMPKPSSTAALTDC